MDLSPFGAITSVVVERGGETVLEQYAEGDADTLRNTRSCTKTVLSLLFGIAAERGVIALDTEVAPGIRACDLLTMTSSLECNHWDDASRGNEELMYPTGDWVGFALSLPRRAERSFSYCTAGVVLLGATLERLLGEPLTQFAERELFGPLGIERYAWPRTPKGETSCAGGVELRSRDLVALGRLALPETSGPVPRAWLDESTSPHARIGERTEYGYLWWIRDHEGRPAVSMAGSGGSRVAVFPNLGTVVVITSANFGVRDAHDLTDALLAELLA
jgi:CubicO group peptidase (beta-lactamase class C family)